MDPHLTPVVHVLYLIVYGKNNWLTLRMVVSPPILFILIWLFYLDEKGSTYLFVFNINKWTNWLLLGNK